MDEVHESHLCFDERLLTSCAMPVTLLLHSMDHTMWGSVFFFLST